MNFTISSEMPNKWYSLMNRNDYLGRIEIYDAKAHGLDLVKYYATFVFNFRPTDEPTEAPGTTEKFSLECEYDEKTDRIVVDTVKAAPVVQNYILMYKLMYIKFEAEQT
jgi:hypothetical protein